MASLARLAVDTGGRFTEKTNDLTLGYARAEHDRSCSYAVGFYDDDPVEDRVHRVVVNLRRPGLRAIHASRYVYRSAAERQRSLLLAAWVSPEMFGSGLVRAHLFPLRPASKQSWEGVLAVSFPVALDAAEAQEATREFGAVLSQGPRVVHRFARSVTLRPHGTSTAREPWVTFLEPVVLEPGGYGLTAVLTDPRQAAPQTARVELEVPAIPRKSLFLVGPLLGRRAGKNVVVQGGASGPAGDRVGDASSFEPLLVQQLDEPDDLLALTQACLVGARRSGRADPHDGAVERTLRRGAEAALGAFPPVELALGGGEREEVRCQNLLDLLPAAALTDGDYRFEATLSPARAESPSGHVRFSVGVLPQRP